MLNGTKISTNMINKNKDLKLAIIGLGYVGLPLALEFAKKRKVVGFDISKKRIEELRSGIDRNLEFTKNELRNLNQLNFTNDEDDLKFANCYIITVPTPIDEFKKPDLKPLINASEMTGKVIKRGDLIIYESTVYPGCIEELCVPTLEKFANLKFNKDFFCGYSPERINPGDKKHTISNIKKVTSGSTFEIGELVDSLYKEIILAGTHKAPSIKVAEAAKVIENTQRDLNIALINELSILFNKMNIDTNEVLDAAGSKWNFLPFKPGLVGGHCIGVDPYYLSYRSSKSGYNPKIILSGRKINNSMPEFVVKNFINGMKAKKIKIKNSKILILGLTFKENCPDVRNSKVFSVIEKLKAKSINVFVHDPWITIDKSKDYDFNMINEFNNIKFDGIILAVGHDKFKMFNDYILKKLSKKNYFLYDLKNFFKKSKLVNLTL